MFVYTNTVTGQVVESKEPRPDLQALARWEEEHKPAKPRRMTRSKDS